MDKTIDLHAHSTASDGSFSPGELVNHAKTMGLYAVALTDHDTVSGIQEAVSEGEKLGVEVVPGIEIGVNFKPEMHILGYFLNQNWLNISNILEKLRKSREERNPKIVAKLNELGFSMTMDEVKTAAITGVVGRPHIAKVMVDKGYVKSMGEAFEKYLASGRPAYFKKDKLSPEEGIGEILKAGGIPVIAHPVHLNMSYSHLDNLLADLKKDGLMGIEAYYVDNTNDDTGNLLRLAIKHDLLTTGGSDFHGSYKPDIELGRGRGNLRIPYELLEKMKEKAK
ncbi:MAG: PHP domain-containing protein [Bacillota bacterium]|nr:PHP domain-containing protein [Bacillota bacterium]